MRIFGIVLAALVLVSCGSSDDPNGPASTTAGGDAEVTESTDSQSAGEVNSGELFVSVEYFEIAAGSADEVPAGEPVEVNVEVDQDIDVDADAGLPFLLAIDRDIITISWTTSADFADSEGVIPAGEAKVLYLNYSEPIFDDIDPQVDPDANLVPTLEVENGARLRISFDAGTEIGDGLEAEINFVDAATDQVGDTAGDANLSTDEVEDDQ